VRAVADAPTTEIFLMDAGLARLASGVGVLHWWGPPGLYKLRFRAGDTQLDRLVELEPGPDPVDVRMAVEFASPVPLEGTSTSHEYHQGGARQLTRQVDATLGAGSRLLVLVRDYDPRADDGRPIAQGLALHDASGRLLYPLQQGREERQAGWAGAHLEVDPGVYRLRLVLDEGRVLEQSVVCSPDWCTQLFLARSDEGGVPDLTGAAVLMARSGAVFEPHSPALRWTEMLRRALERGRPAMPTAGGPLDEVRAAAAENPMLGLLAAHVLLAGDEAARALAGEIAGGLAAALDGHPDLEAVRIALSPGRPGARVSVPPMLRSSWEILLAASVRQPLLMPADSLAARVAGRVVPSGAWLVWQRPDEVPASPSGPPPPPAAASSAADPDLLGRLRSLILRAGTPDALEPPAAGAALTPEEASLLHMLWLHASPAAPSSSPPPPPRPPRPKKGHRPPLFKEEASGATFSEAVDGPDRFGFGPVGGGGTVDRADIDDFLADDADGGTGDFEMEVAEPDAAPEASPPSALPGLDEMVRTLHLPVTAIHGAATSLLAKLAEGSR
jgi:hypothetical protein